jgi:aerobic-type carbon monoxide dehydrogenase small subunit (CoxS/CutS family)
VNVTLTVNGRAETLTAEPHHTLVDALRDNLRLFGVREGCGVGMCGACTVLLDGKAVSGCLVLAPLAEGRDVVTVEGLESNTGELDPVQQSFVDHTAFQCSFCTPGFILAAKELLATDPTVDEDAVQDHLAGNLCRCGSYSKITAAVLDARDRLAQNGVRLDSAGASSELTDKSATVTEAVAATDGTAA